jgi:hypothetical protein
MIIRHFLTLLFYHNPGLRADVLCKSKKKAAKKQAEMIALACFG